jgi:hypothetical protein
MTENDDAAFAEAWDCVLKARTAGSKQLPVLARRLADALGRDPRCGATIMRLAVVHHLASRLEMLAEAAPPNDGGVLHRLAAVARSEQDQDDLDCWEPEEDWDDGEIPA